MAERLTDLLQNYFSPELIVFIISMLPILELRGGLVAASLLGISWQRATVISVIGNVLPIPFILLFIKEFLQFLKRFKPFKRLVNWLEEKAHRKGSEIMATHPHRLQLALFLFVAIPLPGTGAWTGALISAFLGLKISKSAPPICLGVAGAAVIMLIITYLIPSLMGLK